MSSSGAAITIAGLSLTIVTSSNLPAAVQGQGYGISFSATGGEPPYAWSLLGGSAFLVMAAMAAAGTVAALSLSRLATNC